ncbi:MAG: lytic transglycosylase domain-containing protein [Thermoanaerobaculales bacterium]|nr:lytic transglycosylase domain-containing protein [Thermoanaerobaculales bacterium]
MRVLGCLFAGLGLLLVAPQSSANGAVAAAEIGTRSLERSELRKLVHEVSTEHGVDPKLIDALVHVESGYNPNAVSRKGAMGLMQLMPETAKRLKVDDPFNPAENVRGGVKEISRLVSRYSGNLQLALAAYNAGEGAVSKYRGVPPYAETRSYISKILSLYTGRPYRLAGSYRAAPVRMLRNRQGGTIITNTASGASSAAGQASDLQGGPLKGGFGTSP